MVSLTQFPNFCERKMSADSCFLLNLSDEVLALPSFKSIIVPEKSKESEFYIRSNISNIKEIQQWISEFSRAAKTQ